MTISIKWNTEDIIERANEQGIKLSNKQADNVLDLLKSEHDCNIGINWEIIDIWTQEVLNN